MTGPNHEELDKDGPTFSADGKHMAYVGRRAGKWIAVVDGVEGPPYEMIVKGGPRFSPDGSRVAYVARSKVGVLLVVDDAEQSVAWAVKECSLVFSPDWKRLSYVMCEGTNDTGCRMVVDSVAGPIHDWVGQARFSADGKRCAHAAIDLIGLPTGGS